MIHASALVDAKAEIGNDVEIGAFSVIGPNVSIGDRCRIESHCVIKGPTSIGADNHIYQFASIGEAPQDLKYAGEPTRLEIGDGNRIREFTTINRGTVSGGGLTKIGDHNLIMAYCHIAHDCMVGNHIVLSNAASLAGHVVVDDHAILGGFSGVHQFVHIGRFAFTGFHSAIAQDIPPFCLASGNLARIRGINKVGLSRHEFSAADIKALQSTLYRLKKADSRAVAIQYELANATTEHVSAFLNFIANSSRGVPLSGLSK